MSGTDEHVAVMAVRLMNAVENPQAGEEVEGAENSGPPDARTRQPEVVEQLLGGERPLLLADGLDHLSPRLGDPESQIT